MSTVLSVRWHVGNSIFRIGELITRLGEGISSGIWDGSRERSWREGHEYGIGMGLTYPVLAQRIEDEAQRRCEDQRTA